MLAQSRLQIQYGNFCQIFNEVMLPKYSLAEREEMMRLLEDQTLANHLHFLKEQAASVPATRRWRPWLRARWARAGSLD